MSAMQKVSGWRDWMVWPVCAVLLVLAPLFFSGSFALALLSQMGIAIVACLSFNLLFGQGGMLSFGHAVYAGLGGFVAMHALNTFSAGGGWLPVSLVPLCGGLGGLAFAGTAWLGCGWALVAGSVCLAVRHRLEQCGAGLAFVGRCDAHRRRRCHGLDPDLGLECQPG